MRLSSTKKDVVSTGRGLGNFLWDQAASRPSLDLQFADTKSLVDSATGQNLVSFARASSGTYVGSDGLIKTAATNEPRFDHNPTTGESLGLLVEEQRTNLLLQSEAFGTTWAAFGLLAFGSGSTLNATIAPNGLATADLITEATTSGQHNTNQSSTTIGVKHFSVFAKQGPGSRLFRMIDFNLTDGTQGETYFNLSNGTVVSGTGSIQAFPNGWYRCSIQSTTTVTSTYYLSLAQNSTTFSYSGDGTSGIYLWGAQLEAGAFPTSYIPTTTSAATRAADVASITGSNFSSWYRQDEGTVFAECAVAQPVSGGNQFVFRANDSGFNNNITINIQGAGSAAIATAAGGVFDGIASGPLAWPANTTAKSAGAYASNNLGVSLNGATAATDTSATMPTALNRLDIGSDHIGANRIKAATIKRLTFWPQRLSDSTLQSLAS